MAKRRKTGRGASFPWMRLLLLVLVCFVGGGAAAFLLGGDGLKWDGGWRAGPAQAAGADTELARMSRAELETEVLRLREMVDTRDKQIADLMIQLKLLESGSSIGGGFD